MALGATPPDVLRSVLRDSGFVTLAGIGIGITFAYASSRLLSSLLFAVEPTDASTYVFVAAVLIAVAMLSSYLPARRASHVDPMIALRTE
jgi:ABC-type antimicrobial peptide transport system permease subunit